MPFFDFRRLFGRSEHRNIRINLRLVAILAAGLVLTAGLAHFVRGMQLDRNAKSLQHKAQEAYAQGDLDGAIGYQARYVTFRPRETDELVRLAEWSDENAKLPRDWFSALQQVDRALTQATTRDDLRRRAIRLAAKLAPYRGGTYQDVLKRVSELREKDAEMLAIEARAHAALGDYDRAAQGHLKAIEKAPSQFTNYEDLLALCERRAGKLRLTVQDMERFFFPPPASDERDADKPPEDGNSEPAENADLSAQPIDDRLSANKLCEPIVRAMIERAEPKFKAWLARARYHLAQGKLPEAASDVTHGREAAPDDPDVLLMATEIETSLAADARVKGRAEAAIEHTQAAAELGRRGLVRAPSDLRFYLTLSRLKADAGLVVDAELILREGLKAASDERPGDHHNLRPEAGVKSAVIWALAGNLITQAFPQNGPANEEKLAEAEALIEELRRLNARPAWIDFLQARILLGKNDWDSAARRLEKARGGLVQDPIAARSVDKSLADCYTRLSNPDARLRVYRRAIEEDPFWLPGRLGLADTLVSLGQFDAALEQYAPLVDAVPGVAARVSQLLIRKQMALPEKQRNWDKVEKVLQLAEQQAAGSPQAVMLRADVLLRQRRFDELDRLLHEALERDPGETAYWVAVVESALRRGEPGDETRVDRAEQALERARQQLGDLVELRLLAIRLAVARGGSQATAILAGMQSEAGALPPADRSRVLRTLALAWQAIGAPERGLALWQTVCDDSAADLDDQLLLADLATRAGDAEALQKALKQIRRIEGLGGPNGDYAEAAALIINVSREREKTAAGGERPRSDGSRRAGSAVDLERAQRLLTQAARQRPSWAAVPRTLGLLEELRGNRDEAFEQFRRAIFLGDRTRDTVQQVILRLNALGRYEEAREELRRAVETAPDLISGDLARLASVVAAKLRNVDEALDLAGKIAPEARNFGDLLWQAELQYSKGERGEKIDELLRQATVTAPDVERTWVTRVAYLVRENRPSEARQVTSEAAEKFPPERLVAKLLTLALCYEALGDRPAAELNFLKAIDAEPTDVAPKTEALNFYIRGNELAKADGLAQKLLDPAQKASPSIVGAAHRTRALIRASGGTYEDLQAALTMLGGIKPDADLAKVDEADLRAASTILSRSRLRSERALQLRILEELARRQRLKNVELLQLARLLEGAGRWAGARSIYRRLLEADPSNAAVLAEFVLTALRQKSLDPALLAEVAERVDQLERREPDSYRSALARARYLAAEKRQSDAVSGLVNFLKRQPVTVVVDERLRQLVGQKKLEEALAVLAESVRRDDNADVRSVLAQAQKFRRAGDDEAALAVLRRHLQDSETAQAARANDLKRVAGALESLGAGPAAEDVYRQYAALAGVDGQMALISFLARQNKINEALDLCNAISDTASAPLLARVSLGVLRAGRATPEQIARVEARIVEAAEKASPELKTGFELALAELREIQGRYPDVLQIYRSLLDRNDRNVLALNNLAWFQSFDPAGRRSSLDLINRAVQLAGPDPELLDTRAVIQLNLDSPREAIRDLEQALKENNTPSLWFHLSLAQNRVGDKAAAAESLRNADQAGLDPGALHPFEKADYEKLVKSLAPAARRSGG